MQDKYQAESLRFNHNLQRIVPKLLKDYKASEIRAGAICFWAESNNIDLIKLKRGLVTSEFLSSTPSKICKNILQIFKKLTAQATIKDVEGIFERCIDLHRRKSQGAVYTPKLIINNLITHGLSCIRGNKTTLRICDPACGSGGFLIEAADILAGRTNNTLEDIFEKCLFGIDNDEWAIKHAKLEANGKTRGIRRFIYRVGSRFRENGSSIYRLTMMC
jgi:hypothetical protein